MTSRLVQVASLTIAIAVCHPEIGDAQGKVASANIRISSSCAVYSPAPCRRKPWTAAPTAPSLGCLFRVAAG